MFTWDPKCWRRKGRVEGGGGRTWVFLLDTRRGLDVSDTCPSSSFWRTTDTGIGRRDALSDAEPPAPKSPTSSHQRAASLSLSPSLSLSLSHTLFRFFQHSVSEHSLFNRAIIFSPKQLTFFLPEIAKTKISTLNI